VSSGVVVSTLTGSVSPVGVVVTNVSIVVDALFELSSPPLTTMAAPTPTAATSKMHSQLHAGSPTTLRFHPDGC
jgi:hypothetical protein